MLKYTKFLFVCVYTATNPKHFSSLVFGESFEKVESVSNAGPDRGNDRQSKKNSADFEPRIGVPKDEQNRKKLNPGFEFSPSIRGHNNAHRRGDRAQTCNGRFAAHRYNDKERSEPAHIVIPKMDFEPSQKKHHDHDRENNYFVSEWIEQDS